MISLKFRYDLLTHSKLSYSINYFLIPTSSKIKIKIKKNSMNDSLIFQKTGKQLLKQK